MENQQKKATGNPTDADGNVLECHVCESLKHFADVCPDCEKNKLLKKGLAGKE